MREPVKLRAEWFWVDRWTNSSAFALPISARGLYREMLTQAWIRGGELPNDPKQIRRICGVTAQEWRRAWPLVAKYWCTNASATVIFNATQQRIFTRTCVLSESSTQKASHAARARYEGRQKTAAPSTASSKLDHDASSSAQAVLEHCPLSLSLSNEEEKSVHTRAPAHLRHAVCGRVCLHENQFDQFLRKAGGDSSTVAARVRRWALAVLAEWEGPRAEDVIQGNNFAWWDARWLEYAGPPGASRLVVDTEPPCAHVPQCLGRVMHRRLIECEAAMADGRLTVEEGEQLMALYKGGNG